MGGSPVYRGIALACRGRVAARVLLGIRLGRVRGLASHGSNKLISHKPNVGASVHARAGSGSLRVVWWFSAAAKGQSIPPPRDAFALISASE